MSTGEAEHSGSPGTGLELTAHTGLSGKRGAPGAGTFLGTAQGTAALLQNPCLMAHTELM